MMAADNHDETPPKTVEVYTDGACSGNPGPGGWGAILMFGKNRREIKGGEKETTNNRMELMAAIEALNALKAPCRVELYTDSNYVRQGISQWIHNWKRNGWRTANKKPVKNADLWQVLDEARRRHLFGRREDFIIFAAGHIGPGCVVGKIGTDGAFFFRPLRGTAVQKRDIVMTEIFQNPVKPGGLKYLIGSLTARCNNDRTVIVDATCFHQRGKGRRLRRHLFQSDPVHFHRTVDLFIVDQNRARDMTLVRK